MSTLIRKNARVPAHQLDREVWGLYHLDRGNHLLIDPLDHVLLDLAESFRSRGEIVAACAPILEASNTRGLPLDPGGRLDRLFEFGALIEVDENAGGEVLLIDPPAASEHQVGMRGPAMGLCYLSAALARQGLPAAKILDLRSVSPIIGYDRAAHTAYFGRYAAQCAPRIVGVTAVSATIENALFIARLAKLLFPDCFLVLGGPHASYEWEALLSLPFVDAVVRGEGELPFPRLVERILQPPPGALDFSDIPGVAWRTSAGQPVSSGWCTGEESVDSLRFPDLHDGLINRGDYEILFPRIMSSRGCPFTCSFCSTATFTGRRVRYRSSESVLAEIRQYHERYGLHRFVFDDDIFTVYKKRAIELCRAIASLPFAAELQWGCNTRIDCLDDETLDALYDAGCRNILFGVESGDIDVQTRFAKGKRGLEGFQHKIERMLEKGMEPYLNFILGLPGENRESIEKIMTLIERFPEVPCAFNFLSIYPGTPLERQMKELGIAFLGDDARTRYSLTAPTIDSPTLSAEEQIYAYLRLQWGRQRLSGERGRAHRDLDGDSSMASVA